jgi:hypothetical protein
MNIPDSIKNRFKKFFNLDFSGETPEAGAPPPLPEKENTVTNPPEIDDVSDSSEKVDVLESFIKSVFLEFLQNYPDDAIQHNSEDDIYFIADESEQSYVLNATNQILYMVSRHEELANYNVKCLQHIDSLKAVNAELEAKIESLTSQLAAKPTIPLNVADPAISVGKQTDIADNTGKSLLENLPHHLRSKIKKS